MNIEIILIAIIIIFIVCWTKFDEIVDYMANTIVGNIRELEGALNSVVM